MANLELDYMEYATDGAAQAAYVTNATGTAESVDQEQTTIDLTVFYLGDSSDVEIRQGQSFQLSGDMSVSAVEIKSGDAAAGSPSGNWTLRIETVDGGGKPSGTLVDAGATVDVTPPAANTVIKGTFATPIALSGSTTYWLVIQCANQSTGVGWYLSGNTEGGYANGARAQCVDGTWADPGAYDLYFKVYKAAVDPSLQSYSEATIKTQGSYSLKGVARATDSLNKTLTRTI